MIMVLLSTFALVALSLGAVGVYGVTAYSVSRRTSEIGVRMALGATNGSVLSSVLRQGMGQSLLGIAFGVADVVHDDRHVLAAGVHGEVVVAPAGGRLRSQPGRQTLAQHQPESPLAERLAERIAEFLETRP